MYCIVGHGKFSTVGVVKVLGKCDVAPTSANEAHDARQAGYPFHLVKGPESIPSADYAAQKRKISDVHVRRHGQAGMRAK